MEFHLSDFDQSAGQAILGTVGGSKKDYISSSNSCYGYEFPIKNLYNLNRFTSGTYGSKIRKVSYLVPPKRKITIKIPKKEATGAKLYKILDKFQVQK